MSGGFRPRDIQGFYTLAVPGGNPFTGVPLSVNMEATFTGAGGGYDLLDLTSFGPTRLIPKVPGLYAFHLELQFDNTGGGVFGAGAGYVEGLLGTASSEPPPANFQALERRQRWWLDANATGYFIALDMVKYFTHDLSQDPICAIARNVAATSIDINGYIDVVQLAT